MEKHFDINERGLSVRCKLFYEKDFHRVDDVVIVTHGFGSGKDNKSIAKFAERLIAKYKGYGAIAFDWPAHGEDARKKLLAADCLAYLQAVIDYAEEKLQAKNLYAYSTSFGGYLTLKYIAEAGNPFRKIVLKAPALKIYDILTQNMTEEDRRKIAKGKEVMLGFARKMKIGKEFLDELKQGDITQNDYLDDADDILILHGTADEMVDLAQSQAFADKNVIELITVENADHPFSHPKAMDFAIQKTVEFFAPKQEG